MARRITRKDKGNNRPEQHQSIYVAPAIEIVIKIVVVALLIGWCFLILKPFISPVVWGIIMAVWLILVMLSDNVLKPILLGRGAPVPMPVIFLGAIGGFMSMGFLGLFVGGMLFGGLEKQRKHELLLAAEGTGDTLGLDHLGGIQEPHSLNLNI